MATLEELKPGVHLKGLLPGKLVTLIEPLLHEFTTIYERDGRKRH